MLYCESISSSVLVVHLQVQTVGIVIKDVNDNDPVFLGAPFAESVDEVTIHCLFF